MIRAKMTPEQVKAIAAEIDAIHASFPNAEKYRIASITQFYMLPVEVYQVVYEDGFFTVFAREEIDGGKLTQASGLTYWAPNFEHPSKESK